MKGNLYLKLEPKTDIVVTSNFVQYQNFDPEIISELYSSLKYAANNSVDCFIVLNKIICQPASSIQLPALSMKITKITMYKNVILFHGDTIVERNLSGSLPTSGAEATVIKGGITSTQISLKMTSET